MTDDELDFPFFLGEVVVVVVVAVFFVFFPNFGVGELEARLLVDGSGFDFDDSLPPFVGANFLPDLILSRPLTT